MLQGSPALFSADYPSALAAYTRALQESPDFALGRYVLGLAYAGLGDWQQAIAAYRAALPGLGLAIVGGPLIYALAESGDTQAAQDRVAELELLASQRYVPPSKFAVAYLGLGDRSQAMQWLAQAVQARDDRLVYLAVDVHFRDLLDDPAVREIATTVGLLEAIDEP